MVPRVKITLDLIPFPCNIVNEMMVKQEARHKKFKNQFPDYFPYKRIFGHQLSPLI